MPVLVGDIEKGWIYRTSANQERLVLGWDGDGNVIYSARGGNVMNEFKNDRRSATPEAFASDCSEKVRQVPDVEPFIDNNNARDVVVR